MQPPDATPDAATGSGGETRQTHSKNAERQASPQCRITEAAIRKASLDGLGDRAIWDDNQTQEANMMFNMATMAADECREEAQERTWRRWADQAGEILGKYVADGSDEEDGLHDLYLDGCTPSEAVAEMNAQRALAA